MRAVAGVVRRTWCCRDRRAAASGFKRLLGRCVWQGAGVGGTWRPPRPPSETTAFALASRSAAAAFFTRMDVRARRRLWRRAAVTMAGAAMLLRWWLHEQMLDGAMRADVGWRRTR